MEKCNATFSKVFGRERRKPIVTPWESGPPHVRKEFSLQTHVTERDSQGVGKRNCLNAEYAKDAIILEIFNSVLNQEFFKAF